MGCAPPPPIRTPAAARRILAAVLLVALLAGVAAAPGCARDTRAFPQFMDTIPGTVADFTYWDIKTLNADKDLWDIFGAFDDSASARQVKDLLLVLSKVEAGARAVSYDNATLLGPVAIFRGELDMPYLRRQMGDRGYTRSANKEAEVWLPHENYTYTAALGIRGGTVYLGDSADVIACINTARRSEILSLWDDPNLKVVADKLPAGFIVNIHQAAAGGESYPGLVAYGKSFSKAGRQALAVKAVYLFGHDPAARAAQPAILEGSRSLFDDVSVKTEGNLVVVSARVPMARLAESLEF